MGGTVNFYHPSSQPISVMLWEATDPTTSIGGMTFEQDTLNEDNATNALKGFFYNWCLKSHLGLGGASKCSEMDSDSQDN